MKTHTFSVVVGTAACNAECPFCVSKMTRSAACKIPTINKRRLHTACRIVKQAGDGLISVLLTGKGEPLVFPEQVTEYLGEMASYQFPLIDLQTNGVLVNQVIDSGAMEDWATLGLSLACISIVHWEPYTSQNLMGINDGNFDFWQSVDRLHEAGMAVRLNCTLTRSGCGTLDDVAQLINMCRDHKVEQLTLREVEVPDYMDGSGNTKDARKVVDCAETEKPHGFTKQIRCYLEMRGATRLLELPHGAIIYDDSGQNVCINNCLTSTTDPNDIRQVIYFPDGRIMYDWKYPGARLL